MGQAVADLPDPLEKTSPLSPESAKSADDLLSQLAGDEIDRLLAESDGEPAPAPAVAESPPATPPTEPVNLDQVLDTAVAEREALHASMPAAIVEVVQKAHQPQIDLGDSPRRLPLFLRPLEWLSSPLDPWPDQLREILGKIGLMTMVNALAVLAYVMLVRRHHH